MRVAHWSIWAPNRSGMYHTTQDTVLAQRDIGIECGMIDAMNGVPKTDGDFSCERYEYADLADIYLMHLAVPQPYLSDGTPLVVALHGNPLYSMQTELYGLEADNDKPFTTILNLFRRTEPTWFLSFWEEEQGAYWKLIDGMRDRLWFAPRGLRFGNRWTPDGPKRSLDGSPVIVIADQFRLFKDALSTLWGAYLYWKRNPKAQVYLFGLPPANSTQYATIERWTLAAGLHKAIGGVHDVVDYLPEVFRRADVLLTTVTGESRVALEAQACGCPVVAPWPGADAQVLEHWQPEAIADGIAAALDDSVTRDQRAERTRERYDIRKTAESLKQLYERVLSD